jgi:hypothetical protein
MTKNYIKKLINAAKDKDLLDGVICGNCDCCNNLEDGDYKYEVGRGIVYSCSHCRKFDVIGEDILVENLRDINDIRAWIKACNKKDKQLVF